MEIDILASIKMVNCMAKVRKKESYLVYDLLILRFFGDSIGKFFWNYGDIFEGEWKDDKKHGKGKEGNYLV